MQYCYVFDNYEGEKKIVLDNSMNENLTIDSSSDFVLVYPKELSKRIIVYQEYINHISRFEVDEENNRCYSFA